MMIRSARWHPAAGWWASSSSRRIWADVCTLERVADHIDHVASVGGEDCVALGSDFDGFLPLPRGLRDAGDLPRLTEILWRRGWRGARLSKLLGENALRFFAAT